MGAAPDPAPAAHAGELPDKWPKIFRRLQYLYLDFNDLHTLDGAVPVPSALPDAWTSDRQRGFPALSVLTLFPGNDFLCSLPDPENGFQDVNLGEQQARQ